MAIYGRGALPSQPHKLARALLATEKPEIAAVLSGAAGSPSGASLLAHFPAVRFDQGQSRACTAHQLASGIYAAAGAAGIDLGFVPSPRNLYAGLRAIATKAATPTGAAFPETLADSGGELADAISAAAEVGVCPIADPTPDGRYSDVWTLLDAPGAAPNVGDWPDAAGLERAATTVATGAYRIDVASASFGDQVAASISAGFPVYVGFFADSAFENLSAGAVAGEPNEADPEGGGHAGVLGAWRRNASGLYEFADVNSWGAGWADSGIGWCSSAWASRVWEAWVLDAKISRRTF